MKVDDFINICKSSHPISLIWATRLQILTWTPPFFSLYLTLYKVFNSDPYSCRFFRDVDCIVKVWLESFQKFTKGVFVHSTHLFKAYKDPFGELLLIHVTSESKGLAWDLLTDHKLEVGLRSANKTEWLSLHHCLIKTMIRPKITMTSSPWNQFGCQIWE